MSDINIKDFRIGLDYRKFKLSLPAGSLYLANNGHITQGGEFEKRKKFLQLSLPSGTFGEQETKTGVMVFGSRNVDYTASTAYVLGDGVTSSCVISFTNDPDNPLVDGDSVIITGSSIAAINGTHQIYNAFSGGFSFDIVATPVGGPYSDALAIALYFPTPVIYQQLTYPVAGVTMSGVISSTYFGGVVQVVTLWSNGDVQVYNGTEIEGDFYFGLQCPITPTPFDIATSLVAQATATGIYTGTVQPIPSSLYFQITGGTSSPGVNMVQFVGYKFQNGFSLLNTRCSGNLSILLNPTGSTDTVTIGSTTYTFVTSSLNTGANRIQIGATASDTLDNFIAAINGAAGSGTLYSTGTVANTQVTAQAQDSGSTVVVAKNPAASQVSIVTTTNNGTNWQWVDATLQSDGRHASGSVQFILYPTVDWVTDNATTAQAVVNAINWGTYGVNQAGFMAAIGTSPNIVTITPPATDADGNPLVVVAGDELQITPAGNVQVFVPPQSAVFDILSIPSQASANPFDVAVTTENASLPFKLISNGVPSTAPTNAVGQFTLIAGSSNVAAHQTLTFSGIPSANDTVTIGTTVYTYVAGLTGTGYQVLIGGTVTSCINNLISAINGASGKGTTYSINTDPNTQVSAVISGSTMIVTAIVGGTIGDSIATTETSSVLAWGAGTLAGGGPDTNKVSQISIGGTNLLASYVQFNTSVNQTASDIITAINNNQGTSGYSATANGGIISLIANNPGATPNNQTVAVTCAGNVCVANCNFMVAVIAAAQNISAIAANGTALMTATITFRSSGHTTESITDFCARVVANINANSATSLYLAYSSGNQINISALVVSSSDDPVDVEITSTATTIQIGQTTALAVTMNATNITFVPSGNLNLKQSVNAPNSAVATVSGGIPPYKYSWSFVGTTSYLQAKVANSSNQWWTLAKITKPPPNNNPYVTYFPTGTEAWICTVTDSTAGTPQTVISPPIYLTY